MSHFLSFLCIQFFFRLATCSDFSYLRNPSNEIIENQNISSRLVFTPEKDFFITIRQCLFMSISCDIFDNGGAISINNPYTSFSVSQTSFSECKCYQKQGGAIFLKTKNATNIINGLKCHQLLFLRTLNQVKKQTKNQKSELMII